MITYSTLFRGSANIIFSDGAPQYNLTESLFVEGIYTYVVDSNSEYPGKLLNTFDFSPWAPTTGTEGEYPGTGVIAGGRLPSAGSYTRGYENGCAGARCG